MTISATQRAEVERTLDRYMSERGLKSTRQRDLIIDAFFGMHGHNASHETESCCC